MKNASEYYAPSNADGVASLSRAYLAAEEVTKDLVMRELILIRSRLQEGLDHEQAVLWVREQRLQMLAEQRGYLATQRQ